MQTVLTGTMENSKIHRSRKHLASTSPSFPVAVSGSVSPSEAPAQMGRFWLRHHCFVHDRQGLEGLSAMSNRSIV